MAILLKRLTRLEAVFKIDFWLLVSNARFFVAYHTADVDRKLGGGAIIHIFVFTDIDFKTIDFKRK